MRLGLVRLVALEREVSDLVHLGPAVRCRTRHDSAGWMLLDDGWPDVVEFVSATGERLVAEPEKRPDLRTAFPQIDGSENGGYRASLPKQVFGQNGTWDITIRGQRGAETVFSCRIKREHEPARALRAPHWSGDTMHVYGRA